MEPNGNKKCVKKFQSLKKEEKLACVRLRKITIFMDFSFHFAAEVRSFTCFFYLSFQIIFSFFFFSSILSPVFLFILFCVFIDGSFLLFFFFTLGGPISQPTHKIKRKEKHWNRNFLIQIRDMLRKHRTANQCEFYMSSICNNMAIITAVYLWCDVRCVSHIVQHCCFGENFVAYGKTLCHNDAFSQLFYFCLFSASRSNFSFLERVYFATLTRAPSSLNIYVCCCFFLFFQLNGLYVLLFFFLSV